MESSVSGYGGRKHSISAGAETAECEWLRRQFMRKVIAMAYCPRLLFVSGVLMSGAGL